MALNYLDFEASLDTEGQGCFDAMLSVSTQALPAALAEIAAVLDWAHAQFEGQRAPLDEGGTWDFDLQQQQEWTLDQGLRYDLDQRRFASAPGAAGLARHQLTLSLSGTASFCEAFGARFGPTQAD